MNNLGTSGAINPDELIGQVAVAYIKECAGRDDEDGVARYLLDCLTARQTVAIAKAILADVDLSPRVEIKLPQSFVGTHGLPAEVLTNERSTFFRHHDFDKDILLLASTGDDERFSLKELTPIGADQLRARPDLWIKSVEIGLALSETDHKWWCQALSALLQVRSYPLIQLSEFVSQTAFMIKDEGEPLLESIGEALPALRIPRDKTFFTVLTGRTGGHITRWRALFQKAIRTRACYILKQTPAQSLLTTDSLQAHRS